MKDPSDVAFDSRVERYQALSQQLGLLSDLDLVRWISASQSLTTHGHGALSLPPGGETVFVKLLPLTAVELEPQNRHSTANLFELPTYYQYRMGGCGFGTWRELEVHRLTTEWVLSGQCTQLPLMYGWRVLPVVCPLEPDKKNLDLWGNHPAIARRVESVAESTQSVVLFLEHFPQNLSQSLQRRLRSSEDCVGVMEETEAEVRRLLEAIHRRGLTHMDAHFENVLTDGSRLFLSDFGLSICASFSLGGGEDVR